MPPTWPTVRFRRIPSPTFSPVYSLLFSPFPHFSTVFPSCRKNLTFFPLFSGESVIRTRVRSSRVWRVLKCPLHGVVFQFFFFSFSTRFPLYLSFSISFSVIVLHVPDSSSYFLIFNACVFLSYLFFIPFAVSFELLPLFISLSFYFITEVKRNHRRSSTP